MMQLATKTASSSASSRRRTSRRRPRPSDPSPINIRLLATAFGIVLIAAAFVPSHWFLEAINQPANALAFQIGVLILRFCFAAEGLICVALGTPGRHFARIASSQRVFGSNETTEHPDSDLSGASNLPSLPTELSRTSNLPSLPRDLSGKSATICVFAITILAAALRFWQSNSGLWLDEITPLICYRHTSIIGLLSVYSSTNNHLLYTILEKAAIFALGETEWVVRLPAVVIGIATVPLAYVIARLVVNRFASVATALLMATSFHLVFFSQNARGYSGFLFCSLCATIFFIRGLKQDRARDWILYAVSMVFDVAFLLGPSVAVLSAHIFVGAASLVVVGRRGVSVRPLLIRLSSVLAVTCLLMLHLYALIFPQALLVLEVTYKHPSTGFSLFSTEFLQETFRGLFAGYGSILLIGLLPALIILAVGTSSLWRKNWVLVAVLILPQILLGGFMGALKLTVSPRFFILALPAAVLIGVAGFEICCVYVCRLLKRPTVAGPLMILALSVLLIGSTPSLLRYYALPKQDFKTAVQYMKSIRGPHQVLMPIYTSEGGFEYYADEAGLKSGTDYFVVRDQHRFDSVLAHRQPENVLVLTTFARALHMDHPELEQLIAKDWQVAKIFPGTIGDGAVTVWTAKKQQTVATQQK